MRAVVAKLYQRVSNFTIALILAVSSVTAVFAFANGEQASAFPLTQYKLTAQPASQTIEASTGIAAIDAFAESKFIFGGWNDFISPLSATTISAASATAEVSTDQLAWSSSVDVTANRFNKAEGTFYVRSNVLGAHAINLSASIETTEGMRNLTATATVNVEDTIAPGLATNPSPADGAILNMDTLRAMGFSWTAPSDATALSFEYGVSTAANKNQVWPDSGGFVRTIPNYNGSGRLGNSTPVPDNDLPDGEYYWQVRYTDAAGNKGPWAMWSFTIDSTIPTFTLTDDGNPRTPILDGAVINPTKLGDKDSNGDTIRFAKESASDVLYVNGSKINASGYVGSLSGQIGWKFTSEGTYTLQTEDLAGNKSTPITFTVDTTKPGISILPGVPSKISGAASVDVTIDDDNIAGGKNKTIWVELYGRYDQSNKKGAKVNLSSGTGTFIVDTTGLPDGEYIMRVGSVVDAAGNASGDKTFKYFTVDNTPPTIYIKQGLDLVPTSLIGNIFNTVSFKLFDAQNIDKVEINGVLKDLSNNTSSDVNGVTVGVFGAIEGSNTIVVYDEVGNTTTYFFVIDTTAPAVPANLVWTPTGEAALASGDITNVIGGSASWDASDSDTVQYIYKYWNDIVGNAYKEATPWTTTSGLNSLPGTFNQGDGTHYFSVAAVDAAGNQSAFSVPFAVVFDNTKPVVTINALITTDTTPTLTGSVDDTNATVVVTIGSVDYTATNNGDGTWTVTIPALALGTYTATVTATDAATNVGTATADVTVEQVVVQENNPDTDEDDETAPQTIVTPTPDPDVLGEQDDQEQAADDADNSDQGVAAAQDENSEDSSNDGTIAGLAWYWWLLILAAVAGFIWWLIGALRRRSAES